MGGRGRYFTWWELAEMRVRKSQAASRANGATAGKKMKKIRVPFLSIAYGDPDEHGFCLELKGTATVNYKSPKAKGVYDEDELHLITWFWQVKYGANRPKVPPDGMTMKDVVTKETEDATEMAVKCVQALNKDPSKKLGLIKKIVKQNGWKFKP